MTFSFVTCVPLSLFSVDAADPEFTALRALFDQLESNFTNGIAADVFPILKYFPSKVFKIVRTNFKSCIPVKF